MSNILLILISLIFSSLAIIFSVECGYCIASIFPKLSAKSNSNIALDNQLWKIINSITELLILCLLILLRNANIVINNAVFWFLIISLVAIIIKTTIRTYIRKNKKAKANILVKKSYLVSSYIAASSLGSLAIYFVTGKQFWQSFAGYTLFITMLLGITVIGLSFVNRKPNLDKDIPVKQFLQSLFVFWVIGLGFVYPISLAHYSIGLLGLSLSIMEAVLFAAVFGYTISAIKHHKPHELYQYCFMVGFISPILIAWNNRPYLIYQSISLKSTVLLNSYHHSMEWLVLLTVIIMFVLLVFSLYLITLLLVPKLNTKKA